MAAHALHTHRLLILLVTLALLHGALYAALIPPWQAPDETGHLEYAWLLAHLRRIPTRVDISPGYEAQLIDSLYRYRFGDYTRRSLPDERPARLDGFPLSIVARRARTVRSERFSLGYAVQALAALPLEPKSMEAQLYTARLSSALLNALIVAMAYLTFRQLFPGHELPAFLAAGIVLLIPQHTFINATAGDGTLAEAGAAAAIYGWVRAYSRRFGPLEGLAIVAGTLIGNLSKNSVLFLIPADALLAAWWLARRFWHGWRWWQAAALLATAVFLCAGLWLWRDSALGQRAVEWLGKIVLSPDGWALVDRRGLTLQAGFQIVYDSLWANFGWFNLPMPNRWYGALLALAALSLLGWPLAPADAPVRAGFKPAPTSPARWAIPMSLLLIVVALAVFAWTCFLSRVDGYFQFQGRYLFPVVIPFAYLLAGGWDRLTAGRRAPTHLLLAALAFFDAWAISMYIVPYYYG